MDHNNESDLDGLGHAYPAMWKAELTSADEPRIRRECFILPTVNLHFDTEQAGAVVRAEENKVCLYEAMF